MLNQRLCALNMQTYWARRDFIYLHEALSSDKTLSAEGVNQSADVLLVLIGLVQRTQDHLTEHLWQEMLWSLHLPHAVHSLSQVLSVQVVGHDSLLDYSRESKTSAAFQK